MNLKFRKSHLRVISALTVILSLLVGFAVGEKSPSTAYLLAFGVSGSILMMIPWNSKAANFTLRLAFLTGICCVAVILLSSVGILVAFPFTMACCLLTSVPPLLLMARNLINLSSDSDKLSGRVSLLQLLGHHNNMVYTSAYVVYSLCAYQMCSAGSNDWGSLCVAVFSINVLAYIYLYVRNLKGGDLGLRMGHKAKVSESSAFDAPADLSQRLLYDRVVEYMDKEKPYLSPNFSLDEMAKAMYTNNGYISRMINNCSKTNFSQFVNGYRVNYAMELFKNDPSLKVVELGQLAGFNTKVTFNIAFKLVNNLTPGEWCRRYLDSMRFQEAPSSQLEQEL